MEREREIKEIENIFKNTKERNNYCQKQLNYCFDKIDEYDKTISQIFILNFILYSIISCSFSIIFLSEKKYLTFISTFIINIILFCLHTKILLRPFKKLKL